jgi:hypothetical protein
MSKPVVRYRILRECKVGQPAIVITANHPLASNVYPVKTSPVAAYDPSTGFFETRNTCYVPGPFAEWPHGQDCPVPKSIPQ